MLNVLALALPYFGLILIGFACGRLKRLPEAGLAWLNFFLIYVSLPALFFRTIARTPFSELVNPPFILATTLATAFAFTLAAAMARVLARRTLGEAAIAGLAGGYGNIGYMGPGLALASIGPAAAVPVALIFFFDTVFLFSVTPLMVALDDSARLKASHASLLRTMLTVGRQIVLHPLLMALWFGGLAAALQIPIAGALDQMLLFLQSAAAPVALFALGVTVALRPVAATPRETPVAVIIKLVVHPLMMLGLLWMFGPFNAAWSATALMMAALPPALNVFLIARQYERWIDGASAAVLIGTFVSIVTLTTMLWLITTGLVPLP